MSDEISRFREQVADRIDVNADGCKFRIEGDGGLDTVAKALAVIGPLLDVLESGIHEIRPIDGEGMATWCGCCEALQEIRGGKFITPHHPDCAFAKAIAAIRAQLGEGE